MDQDKLRDIVYRHHVASRDIGKEMADKFVRLLNTADDDLVAQITKRYARIEKDGFDKGPATTKRLEDMLAATRATNTRVYKRASDGLQSDLFDVAKHEAEFAAKAVKAAGASIDSGTTIPSHAFLKTLITTSPIPFSDDGKTLLMPWLGKLESGRFERLEGALRLGILEGETTAKMVGRVDGILEGSRKSAQTVVLTANAAVQNSARTETYKNMKSIRYVEWSSILDGRTSQLCQSRSGKIYELDKPHPSAPAHPRCRSMLIPRRDAEGNKHQPFNEWLAGQPEAVQDSIMGKERADIFRANPKMDWDQFFRENGSYKSLDELRTFDEKMLAEKATPARAAPKLAEPVKPKRLESPINPAVNENTIAVISRKEAEKRLSADFARNAGDYRYDPLPEFGGVKVDHFGKAQLPAALSNEASSALDALMPEVDAIADAFAIPRLRAVRGVRSSSSIANMGDGILGVNATHFNAYAQRVGGAAEAGVLTALRSEQAALRIEIAEGAARVQELRDRIKAATDHETKLNLYVEERAAYNRYKKAFEKEFKVRKKIATFDRAAKVEVSEWKSGDDPAKRPHGVEAYFSSGIDRMRVVLFHEMAHHVHQQRGRAGRRRVVGIPPIEKHLATVFGKKFSKFEKPDRGNKARITSTYGTTNGHEWFAESFAAYFMGRKDLADPDVVKLIEDLLDGRV